MSVLVLTLAGPLQSWGSESRFTRRMTEPAPTKSGVIGLLAAAQGRRRTDPLEDLLDLRFAVRIDQPGTLLRDFHTASRLTNRAVSMPLSQRYYLEDAVFTAYLEGPEELVNGLAHNLSRPTFPLYLGRRSCPPARYPFHKVVHKELADAVIEEPWAASERVRERHSGETAVLTVLADAGIELGRTVTSRRRVADAPVSFDPERRRYSTREVVETSVEVPNDARSTEGEQLLEAARSSSKIETGDGGADYADPMSIFGEG